MKNKDNIKVQTPIEQEQNDENIPKNREDEDVQELEWGKHPNSLKALKKNQYPKGVSGNLNGRKPKYDALAKELKELGEQLVDNYCGDSLDGHFEKHKRKDLVLRRIWNDAIEGDMKKIELLAYLGCFND